MPELPEVETTCRGIRPHMLGQTIEAITIRNGKLRQPVSYDAMQQCHGQSIVNVYRRAKYIILQLEKGCILIHLGMSGHLRIVDAQTALKKHDHIDLHFDEKCLRYNDPRRFGLWEYHPKDQSEPSLLTKLGPEPLDTLFNQHYLYQQCQKRKTAIKAVLMNNAVVVGVGNIYATEALFQAKIHPRTAANRLNTRQCAMLSEAIKETLEKAICAGGTSLQDFVQADGKPGYFQQSLTVYGRSGETCLLCDNPIETARIAGRNSYFCPMCQKGG